MSKSVVVAKFSFPIDANIAKANLESVGIPCFIADEHTVNMQWLYSNAMGGVRPFVPQYYVNQAKKCLSEDFSAAFDLIWGAEPDICPHCSSENVGPFTKGKKPAFLMFMLLGFPLFFYQHRLKCGQCFHFWKT